MADRKAELERKKLRLQQIREEKKRKEEEKKKKEVRKNIQLNFKLLITTQFLRVADLW